MRMIVAAALIGALTAVPAVAEGISGPVLTGARLDIAARGVVQRVPDLAIISAGVVTQAADARGAMSANSTALAQVLAALRRAGVADRDMATAQIALSPQYRYADNKPPVITGYQATNSVTIRFRDIAKAGGILDALVSAGANQVNGPNLTLDKPEAALDEARVEAMRMARARADLYARAAGLTVKRIVAVSETGMADRPIIVTGSRMMRMDAAAAPPPELVPGEQDIGVTVNVTFELQ